MSECGFAWTDDWGPHMCGRSGAHNLHLCRCDASRVRESAAHDTAWGARRVGGSVVLEEDVPTSDEVA